jgi:hypothetical protein
LPPADVDRFFNLALEAAKSYNGGDVSGQCKFMNAFILALLIFFPVEGDMSNSHIPLPVLLSIDGADHFQVRCHNNLSDI